jgi:phage gp45-like
MKDVWDKNQNTNGCIICGMRRAYRIKGLDPENRQFEICVNCLAGKMCELIKGGICEVNKDGLKQTSGEGNTVGRQEVPSVNSPSQGDNKNIGNGTGKPKESPRNSGLLEQI